jgi:hypothetical protein
MNGARNSLKRQRLYQGTQNTTLDESAQSEGKGVMRTIAKLPIGAAMVCGAAVAVTAPAAAQVVTAVPPPPVSAWASYNELDAFVYSSPYCSSLLSYYYAPPVGSPVIRSPVIWPNVIGPLVVMPYCVTGIGDVDFVVDLTPGSAGTVEE